MVGRAKVSSVNISPIDLTLTARNRKIEGTARGAAILPTRGKRQILLNRGDGREVYSIHKKNAAMAT